MPAIRAKASISLLPNKLYLRYNCRMNAICLVFDRLHVGYLGPYGNSWIETPAWNRLASQSMVFDQALIDSPDLQRLYRSYWQGWHAMCPAPPADDRRWPRSCAMLA